MHGNLYNEHKNVDTKTCVFKVPAGHHPVKHVYAYSQQISQLEHLITSYKLLSLTTKKKTEAISAYIISNNNTHTHIHKQSASPEDWAKLNGLK